MTSRILRWLLHCQSQEGNAGYSSTGFQGSVPVGAPLINYEGEIIIVLEATKHLKYIDVVHSNAFSLTVKQQSPQMGTKTAPLPFNIVLSSQVCRKKSNGTPMDPKSCWDVGKLALERAGRYTHSAEYRGDLMPRC